MRKPVVLELFEPKNVFDKKIINNDCKYFLTARVPAKRKYIKKFVKSVSDETVIVKPSSAMSTFLKGKTYLYGSISIELVAEIIEKLCRDVAKEKSVEIPFDEVVIFAPEKIAYTLIFPLVNISRMFTVVSDTYNVKKNDEMYFKYGCIIRNKTESEVCREIHNLVICADTGINCERIRGQIINLTPTEYVRNNIVNIRDIKVCDDRISDLVKQWGGVPGLELYDLLGVASDCKTDIDINIKNDKIFLLDISKF